ncbi:fatty acyl-AMP ligase [Flavihumibacter petaseus]|uniref:Putative fatty acid--CoA ligase n=1 Tax=Flavihumibacter petaseus NBRC 106054 TaxID=1220578 RepID=A0A0E9MV54_9BACT|nr:fatty acyl-AMP ligase [Flavihumibacter petaseus]GAO41449.1 putative fatty acid--CoA ligase [Flavihumibacter petaseus NBRC 106054]
MTHLPNSLVDILRWRAIHQPQRLAYRYLIDGEFDEAVLTYEELDRRTRAAGTMLQAATQPGDRVLLLLPPGPDFIVAFFSCLYAGVIAVPSWPPHPARLENQLVPIQRLVENASPAAVWMNLTLAEKIHTIPEAGRLFQPLKVLLIEAAAAHSPEHWRKPAINGSDIAFLQYTSGSTTLPRGVMVTHHNLLHNLGMMENKLGQSTNSHAVIWLPPYHDMGLVGGILQPLFTGYPATILPHLLFLQRPVRWLQAISRFGATTSGGPNFAYDLCLRKIKPEQRDQLQLNTWTTAFNGAEQVSAQTVLEFTRFFAPCGFHSNAWVPCYGLAEATLMVSGRQYPEPLIRHLDRAALEQQRVSAVTGDDEKGLQLVACGTVADDQQVIVVDPHTLLKVDQGNVGEIWIKGPSVAKGYWNNPAATEQTFSASRTGQTGENYLRTGDMGFLAEGELFITGRWKDVIIADGHNHYACDIEKTVEHSHPAIRLSGCAAIGISRDNRERLVILAEIEQQTILQKDAVTKAIRTAVSLCHELQVDDIRFVYPGAIPRTRSGKIKHYACKTNYLNGNLKEIIAI